MPAITFSGLASGIDGEAIIKTLSESRRIVNLPLENRIQENANENSALEELSTQLAGLKGSLKDFLTLTGGAFSKISTSSNEDILSASSSSNAPVGSSTISNVTVARPATFSFGDRFSSFDEPLVPDLTTPANLSVSIGSGENMQTAQVQINATTTLEGIALSIDEQLAGSVATTVINTGSELNPQYTLLINGTISGAEQGKLALSVDTAITELGIFASSTLEQSRDASLTVTGLGEITRPTNQISDLLPGVTLNLKKDSAGPINISVRNDNTKTSEKFAAVVQAFNELITYSRDNSKIERIQDGDEVSNIYGTLAKTTTDENVVNNLRSAWANANSGTDSSSVRILADLGVSTQRDGTLEFDQQRFEKVAAEDPEAVQALLNAFADSAASTNGLIDEYTRFQGIIEKAIETNKSSSQSLNDRIQRVETSIAQQEDSLRLVFANLESTISRLNQQGSALQSLLFSAAGN